MAKKKFHGKHIPADAGAYSGRDARRMREEADSRMISEDHSKVANLPTEVMMKDWPKSNYPNYELDDTIGGIDRQQQSDVGGLERHRSRNKY